MERRGLSELRSLCIVSPPVFLQGKLGEVDTAGKPGVLRRGPLEGVHEIGGGAAEVLRLSQPANAARLAPLQFVQQEAVVRPVARKIETAIGRPRFEFLSARPGPLAPAPAAAS